MKKLNEYYNINNVSFENSISFYPPTREYEIFFTNFSTREFITKEILEFSRHQFQ